MPSRLATLVLVFGLAGSALAQDGLPAFSGDRAFELLVAQTDFGPRHPGSEGAAAALAWKKGFLEEHAGRVSEHRFTIADPYADGAPLPLVNLMASFEVSDSRRIAFAAHWDTRPRADQDPDPARRDEPILGANDGASGVAVLLALAEILAENPPPLGVDLILFDGEDYGLEGDGAYYAIGSKQFVHDHPAYRPEALILFDMVGAKGVSIPMEGYSREQAPELTQLVFGRAMALGLDAFDPRPGRPIYDDHIPFLQAGIPAVDLIGFEYPEWHTHADLPDRCSPDSLEQMGRLALALIFQDFAK